MKRAGHTWAVIAGGGTGGHAVPAIAIGQAMVKAGHDPSSLLFVGSERGVEARLVRAAGFDIVLLPGRGLIRRLDAAATRANLSAAAGLLLAAARAVALVGRLRPAVVVSVGGWASAACSLAAILWRVPLVVVEQNAAPGLANRLAGPFAAACAVAFEGTPLPRAVLTGNPVRAEIAHLDRSPEGRRAARRELGLPEEARVVAVSGGSLGSARINWATLGLARQWASRGGIAIRHVLGERDYEAMAPLFPKPPPGGLLYQPVRFEDRVDLLFRAADVAVQRAGATTVAELAAAGLPAVLVPLPGAPGDHQARNAAHLAAAGAAVVVRDAELDPARLAAELDRLLGDAAALEKMASAARALARPDAAAAVAALADRHARSRGGRPENLSEGAPRGAPESAPGRAPDGGQLELARPRRVHIVGVGGTGMSAIAAVLLQMGHQVSGSDAKASAALDRLASLGATVWVGHDPAHLRGAEVVARSSAVPDDNPEVAEAARLGLRVWRRSELLRAVCSSRRVVAVAGTHGKTTTSAMLALVLREAGMCPSYVVGGDIAGAGGGSWDPRGEWFVVEADESDGTFLELGAEAVVVTSVEPDHLDFFGSEQRLREAFVAFARGARGPRVLCSDDPVASALAKPSEAATYGTVPGSDLLVSAVVPYDSGVCFEATWRGRRLGSLRLAVPGRHNALNAGGALAMGLCLGAGWDEARRALEGYRGVARRMERRGTSGGVTYVDDYAHLPSEVKAAIAAARAGGWGRVVVVFQPHRYSRTAALWKDFADSFTGADLLVVTDVYPAGESPLPGVGGGLIAEAVRAAHPEAEVLYIPGLEQVAEALPGLLRPGDLCLTLGAGDITTLADRLLGALGG